jgi:glycosyltransferase involved in cell wall biosynthesis
MKVILISKGKDYANIAYQFANALKSIGVDAKSYAEHKPGHNYPIFGFLYSDKKILTQMNDDIKDCDVIISMQGRIDLTKYNLKNKKVGVFYGGNNYRVNPDRFNREFNPIVDFTLIQTYDLLGLGAKNESVLPGVVDTKFIKPHYKNIGEKMKVVHCPSNPRKKGTNIIIKVIEKIGDKIDFECFSELDWSENIKKILESDVYIDQFIQELDGNPLCSFGMSSLEAAALGRVVVVNLCYLDKYEKEFGKCLLQITNTEDELERKIRDLNSLKPEDFLNLQKQTREWVVKNHSYKATGQRLLKIIEES